MSFSVPSRPRTGRAGNLASIKMIKQPSASSYEKNLPSQGGSRLVVDARETFAMLLVHVYYRTNLNFSVHLDLKKRRCALWWRFDVE